MSKQDKAAETKRSYVKQLDTVQLANGLRNVAAVQRAFTHTLRKEVPHANY